MIWCHRTRRWPQANHISHAFRDDRRATVTGAAVAARDLFAKGSCAAVGSFEASTPMIEKELTVAIPPDLEAQILRYYHVEKWRAGTIARQLRVHHGTVARVLAQAGLPIGGPGARPSQIDSYLPFIHAILEKFPTLTASRLYAMVRERGYRGGPDHFRHLIAHHRPAPTAEAYLRLRSLAGEQAQVDWGLCRARHSPHYPEYRTMPSIL